MSIVEDAGSYASSCGYCDGSAARFRSHGMHAHACTVEDYQALIDRGWRRSGTWLYKPALDDTCCPAYTIRLDARRFVPNKVQRRVERRFRAYLDRRVNERGEPVDDDAKDSDEDPDVAADANVNAADATDVERTIERAVSRAMDACAAAGTLAFASSSPRPTPRATSARAKAAVAAGATHACAVAFALGAASAESKASRETTKNKRKGGGDAANAAAAAAAALAAALRSDADLAAAEIAVVGGVGGFLNFAAPRRDDKKPGLGVFSARRRACERKRAEENGEASRGTLPPRTFEIVSVPSAFDEEEYRLWRRYQSSVHGDVEEKLTRDAYARFLVDTPLRRVEEGDAVTVPPPGPSRGWIPWPRTEASRSNSSASPSSSASPPSSSASPPSSSTTTVPAPPGGFGSFHQRYLVDGKLVAVGVVDVLPYCLSSKYFFWEPSMAALALGKLSALREIEWVREASRRCPTLGYYYMGYYIHECPKMRYKAEYAPSELKCPVTGQWVDFRAKCAPWLDTRKFAPLGLPMDETTVRTDARADVTDGHSDEEEDGADRQTVGVVAGNALRKVATFGEVVAPLPQSARKYLRRKIVAWRRAVGEAGEGLLYVVNLDRIDPDRDDDTDEDENEEGSDLFESDGEDAVQEEKSL